MGPRLGTHRRIKVNSTVFKPRGVAAAAAASKSVGCGGAYGIVDEARVVAELLQRLTRHIHNHIRIAQANTHEYFVRKLVHSIVSNGAGAIFKLTCTRADEQLKMI